MGETIYSEKSILGIQHYVIVGKSFKCLDAPLFACQEDYKSVTLHNPANDLQAKC